MFTDHLFHFRITWHSSVYLVHLFFYNVRDNYKTNRFFLMISSPFTLTHEGYLNYGRHFHACEAIQPWQIWKSKKLLNWQRIKRNGLKIVLVTVLGKSYIDSTLLLVLSEPHTYGFLCNSYLDKICRKCRRRNSFQRDPIYLSSFQLCSPQHFLKKKILNQNVFILPKCFQMIAFTNCSIWLFLFVLMAFYLQQLKPNLLFEWLPMGNVHLNHSGCHF